MSKSKARLQYDSKSRMHIAETMYYEDSYVCISIQIMRFKKFLEKLDSENRQYVVGGVVRKRAMTSRLNKAARAVMRKDKHKKVQKRR